MKWILNIIGIAIFFLVRFGNRKDKSKEASATFWLKDNWAQLIAVLLFEVGLMLLFGEGGLNISFEKIEWLPAWLQIIGDSATAFVIGLLGAWLAYVGYKKILLEKR